MADIFSGDFPRNFAHARSGGLSFCRFRLGLPDCGATFGVVAGIFLRRGGAYLFWGCVFSEIGEKRLKFFLIGLLYSAKRPSIKLQKN